MDDSNLKQYGKSFELKIIQGGNGLFDNHNVQNFMSYQ